MQQNEVINLLIARFEALYPQFVFRALRRLPPPGRVGIPYDLLLRIALGQSGKELVLGCIVVEDGYHDEVVRAIQRVGRMREREKDLEPLPVLLSPFLSQDDRSLCRQNGIGHLDLVGNAGFEAPGVVVLIERDAPRPSPKSRRTISPYEGKAERVARRMLSLPRKTWNMRELAAQCGISLGMASMVTTVLLEQGIVTKTRKGVTLFDAQALLEAWEKVYQLNKSPYQVYHTSASASQVLDRIRSLPLKEPDDWALTLWSGALHLLDEAPEEARLALYWAGDVAECAERLHLGRAIGDTIILVFQPYDSSVLWQTTVLTTGVRVVNPLQLYLDLTSGDAEELGLARRVRSGFLPC
ncbi:MAG: hypothetical protein ACYCZF_07665 [Anaerolineae bacterium]